jgi:hypothetical protein
VLLIDINPIADSERPFTPIVPSPHAAAATAPPQPQQQQQPPPPPLDPEEEQQLMAAATEEHGGDAGASAAHETGAAPPPAAPTARSGGGGDIIAAPRGWEAVPLLVVDSTTAAPIPLSPCMQLGSCAPIAAMGELIQLMRDEDSPESV